MNTVYIREVAVGEGRPKICVPVCGRNVEEILEEARNARELPADIIEWRADWYDAVFDAVCLREMLEALRSIIGEKPLLFTFRSAQEGGEKAVRPEQYLEISRTVCASEWADALDVELFMGDKLIREIIAMAHEHRMTVVGSNHDFIKTPEKDEITRRLIMMDEAGADILKIAVMPKAKSDVLELLAATEEMGRLYTDKPVVTMSMGAMGLISRLAGEAFGSAMTFGAGKKASAPGQMPAKDLEIVLDAIHESMA
jgi:3-dehydroquinate dehydratase-1